MHRDIVVIGASAGCVEALSTTVSGLPGDLDAAVFVVLHLVPTSTSHLPSVLQRHTPLAVGSAVHGEAIEQGRIYVAPPDHHLLVHRGTVHLSRGPKENGHRPAVDTLFRSAARAYGRRMVGAVLSGTLDDGAVGLRVITGRGGVGVVEENAEPADYTCPECHGTLFRVREGEYTDRYRCRVGHAFSADSLLAGQAQALEAALWSALRAGGALQEAGAARRRRPIRGAAGGRGPEYRLAQAGPAQRRDGPRRIGIKEWEAMDLSQLVGQLSW